jgi:beta-glucanase (GH16 family)
MCFIHNLQGMSQGETLVKPEAYQQLLNLPSSVTTSNTFFTFGISWQPNSVIWSLNGVPLQRRYYDQQVSWTEMDGKTYT